jgi:predicted thioredoxin/glutaredoxin
MSSVSWDVAEHTLNIKPGSKPFEQVMHRFNKEKRKEIGEELVRLLAADFVKEVHHLYWIANLILVPKRMRNEGHGLTILF